MNKLFTLVLLCTIFSGHLLMAQTTEELQATKEMKAKELSGLEGELKDLTAKVDGLKAEVADLTDKLTPYPRWEKGLLGNVGLSFTEFSDWLPKDKPSTSAVNIGLTSTLFANAEYQKSFWRNNLALTLGWLKFDDKNDDTDNNDFEVTADALNLSSLFGWKLSDKWAISTLGEYRTSVLDGTFNDPGYLDLGVGATWTPITDLVVVIHPLNYNFVFSDQDFEFESSLGAKIVADYTRQITKGIAWKSNLSAFMSYEGSDLSNWTWVNSFSTAYKGIGIGFDVGLRNNKQEALAAEIDDNPLQTYWILGLSYAISTKK